MADDLAQLDWGANPKQEGAAGDAGGEAKAGTGHEGPKASGARQRRTLASSRGCVVVAMAGHLSDGRLGGAEVGSGGPDSARESCKGSNHAFVP